MGELARALTPLPYFYDTRKDVVSVTSPTQCKSTDELIFKGQGALQHTPPEIAGANQPHTKKIFSLFKSSRVALLKMQRFPFCRSNDLQQGRCEGFGVRADPALGPVVCCLLKWCFPMDFHQRHQTSSLQGHFKQFQPRRAPLGTASCHLSPSWQRRDAAGDNGAGRELQVTAKPYET